MSSYSNRKHRKINYDDIFYGEQNRIQQVETKKEINKKRIKKKKLNNNPTDNFRDMSQNIQKHFFSRENSITFVETKK